MISNSVSCTLLDTLKDIKQNEKELLDKVKKMDNNCGQFHKITTLCFIKKRDISMQESVYLITRLLFLYKHDKSVKNTIPLDRYNERVEVLQNIIGQRFFISKNRLDDIFVEVFGLKNKEGDK